MGRSAKILPPIVYTTNINMWVVYTIIILLLLVATHISSHNIRIVVVCIIAAAIYAPLLYNTHTEHRVYTGGVDESSPKLSYATAARDVVGRFCSTLPNIPTYKLSYNTVFKCVDAALNKVMIPNVPIKLGHVRTMYGLVLDQFADNKIATESINPNTHIMRSAAFLTKYATLINHSSE